MSKRKQRTPYDAPDHPDLERRGPSIAETPHPRDVSDPLKIVHEKMNAYKLRVEPTYLRPHRQDLERKPQSPMLFVAAGVHDIPRDAVKKNLIELAHKLKRYEIKQAVKPIWHAAGKAQQELGREELKKSPDKAKLEVLEKRRDLLEKMTLEDRDETYEKQVFARVDKEIESLVDSYYDKGDSKIDLDKLIHDAAKITEKGCREVSHHLTQPIMENNKVLRGTSLPENAHKNNHDTGKAVTKSIKMLHRKPHVHLFEKRAKEDLNKKIQEVENSKVGQAVGTPDAPIAYIPAGSMSPR